MGRSTSLGIGIGIGKEKTALGVLEVVGVRLFKGTMCNTWQQFIFNISKNNIIGRNVRSNVTDICGLCVKHNSSAVAPDLKNVNVKSQFRWCCLFSLSYMC